MKKSGKEVNKFEVNPWGVSGNIDYNKLIRDFGVQPIDDKMLELIASISKKKIPLMLRRKTFFAQRDLKPVLEEYKKGNKFFLYTGCGPSGPIHLGHLGTWIFTKWLQDAFDVELWFQFTDDEKFLFKDKSYDEIQKWTRENMLDVIALGFDAKKTHFLVDTKNAGLLYPEAIKVAKKITYSTVKAAFGFNDSKNIGEIFYTSMQAAPVMIPGTLKKNKKIPCLIPLAIDQDPHFRVARDVYPKLGFPKPAIIHGMFLPPLTGVAGKMSSSNENVAILTTDPPKEVERKIKKYAFSGGRDSLEEHRKHGGNPDVDVSYQYLRMFFEPDDAKLKKIHDDYKSGKLTTGELKQITIDKINAFLKEHQKKRKLAEKQLHKFLKD